MKRLAALGALLLLAGCTPAEGEITAVDRRRTEQVRAEALEIGATEPVRVQVGAYWPKPLRWNRSSASSVYWKHPTGATREQVKDLVAAKLALIRTAGWNVLYVACELPPREIAIAAGTPSPKPTWNIGADPGDDFWIWDVRAYRIVDGVSLWVNVKGRVTRAGDGGSWMELVAPNSHEPADLFPDRPTAIGPGTSCLDGGPGATVGTAFTMDGYHVDPHSTPDPNAR